ncbi:MAG: YdcH family protein [Proteobacteria bacterium]|nr:YdcH family protein [Pseudomonadota bacterium]
MFEHQQKDHIEAVMKANPEFRRLYHHHQELDSKVRDAELGVLPMHDDLLHGMKKEKLLVKERLTRMWSEMGNA